MLIMENLENQKCRGKNPSWNVIRHLSEQKYFAVNGVMASTSTSAPPSFQPLAGLHGPTTLDP